MRNLLQRLRHEDEAATAVEYALIAALVGVAIIAALRFFGSSISEMFTRAGNAVSGAGN